MSQDAAHAGRMDRAVLDYGYPQHAETLQGHDRGRGVPLIRFVAEVGSNHNSDYSRALHFIDVAAGIGCWGVKFQAFDTWRDIYADGYEPKKRGFAWWGTWGGLIARARERGIRIGITPFYDMKDGFSEFDFVKVSSYQLLLLDWIERLARTKKPLVISTGMATADEVQKAVDAAKKGGVENLTLLHCVSKYPTPPEQSNLRKIQTLRDLYPGAKIGWSCHDTRAVSIMNVYSMDPSMIEMHMDLDRGGMEYGYRHCFLPEEIEHIIMSAHTTPPGWANEEVLGHGELFPQESEMKELDWRHDPEDGLRPRKFKRMQS